MTATTTSNPQAFNPLSADDVDNQLTEIQSLCMNCHAQGQTRLLLTMIPYYKEVILSSFECDACHFKNNDIQPAQRMEAYGISLSLNVLNPQDMNRQFVKSADGTIRIKELDFEQAPVGANGVLTTIEGFISSVVENINKTIKQIDETTDEAVIPDDAADKQDRSDFAEQREKLLTFVTRIEALKSFSEGFHFEIDDPSGNSFIENPNAPYRDDQLTIKKYRRTAEQNAQLGLTEGDGSDDFDENADPLEVQKDEILVFKTNCPSCNAPCDTNMKVTNIPHFKEIIVMATSCDACGNKSNEVKSGTGIAPKGIRYQLKMSDPIDLNRDILVSETSSFAIPDLDFELSSSRSIGGRFTTLEGIFTTLKTQLGSIIMPFSAGDSRGANSDKNHMCTFIDQVSAILAGEEYVTVVLDDPAGNCYLQNVYAPDPDPNLVIEHYQRSEEQDEALGLTDMNVDHYTQS